MATGEYVRACVHTCFILQACVFQMCITAFEKPRLSREQLLLRESWKRSKRQPSADSGQADRRKSVCKSQNIHTARTQHRKGRGERCCYTPPSFFMSMWVWMCAYVHVCSAPAYMQKAEDNAVWLLETELRFGGNAFTSQTTPLPLLLDLMRESYINKPAFILEKASGLVCGHDWIDAGLAGS